jgi:hypothetical protein
MNKVVNCPVTLVVYRYFVKGQAKEKVCVNPFSNGSYVTENRRDEQRYKQQGHRVAAKTE